MSASILTRDEVGEVRDAERRRLYDRMIEAKRAAETDVSFAAFDFAGRCCRDLMRSYLDDPERRVVELEDEIVRLRAQLRGRR